MLIEIDIGVHIHILVFRVIHVTRRHTARGLFRRKIDH